MVKNFKNGGIGFGSMNIVRFFITIILLVLFSSSSFAITLNATTNRITDVSDPSAAQDVATKAYVDANSGGTFTGSGTTNYLTKFTGATALGNSIMFETSGGLTIAGSRQVYINSSVGGVSTKGDAGSWAFRYGGFGSSGTDLGGFGMFGSANALSYYWIGSAYNSNLMVLETAGDVGIGTTDPNYKLEVVDAVNDAEIIRASTGSHQVGLGIDSAATYWGASIFQDGSKRFTVESNGGILVGGGYQGSNAPANGALIEGNVGIGVTNAASENRLALGAIDSNEGGQLGLLPGSGYSTSYILDNYQGGLRLMTGTAVGTSSAVALQVDSSGNVGIGKSPGTKLDVNGQIVATNIQATANVYEDTMTFTPTQSGWWRIISYGGEFAAGTVRYYTQNQYGGVYLEGEFQYSGAGYGQGSSLLITRGPTYTSSQGSRLTQVRVSNNGGSTIYVDVYIDSASGAQPITFYGYGPRNPGFITPTPNAAAGSGVTQLPVNSGIGTNSINMGGAVTSGNTYGNINFVNSYFDGQGSAQIRGIALTTPSSGYAPAGIGFYTGYNWGPSERMRIDDNGNVGIGTTSTGTYRVNVNGNLNANQLCIAGVCQSSWPAGGGGDATTLDGVDSSQFLRSDATDTFVGGGGAYVSYDMVAGRTIASGSAYLTPLQVFQPTANADAFMSFHISGDYAAYFGIDGTTNDLAYGGWSAGAVKNRVWHAGNDGSGSGLDADTVDGITSGSFRQFNTWQNNHYSGTDGAEYAVIFYDTNNAGYYVDPSSASNINQLTIGGQLYMNSFSMPASGNIATMTEGYGMEFNGDGSHPVQVKSAALLLGDATGGGYTAGYVYANAFVYNSDARLKKNVATYTSGLNTIMKLRPVTFNWINQSEGNGTKYGFIAQEVEKVIPEFVDSGEGRYKTVDYPSFVVPLTSAVQEQQHEIEALQSQIETQQKQIDELKAQVEALANER